MCDTLGFVSGSKAIFGKNSDRSPNEPQILEFIPAAMHEESKLKATYISVPQVRQTHALLLSRPTWLWGGEIGVNDCGVCIGNEAVWTKGKYGPEALTGMDMLRLALERAETAGEAVSVLTEMLERFGQGGNCAYDHKFYYDNSFLVMDRKELYVLETADRNWVWKKSDRATISNRLSIGTDGDCYSSGSACDFSQKHADILYNMASGSKARRSQTQSCINGIASVGDMFDALRIHNKGVKNPFAAGTVSSTCMHFGGPVGDHTTASMVVDLKAGRTIVWATGSSLPCVSLFKPWVFGESPNRAMKEGIRYWYEQEKFRRSLIGKEIPEEYFRERDAIEAGWIQAMDSHESSISERCDREEAEFYKKWMNYSFRDAEASALYKGRWAKKTAVFLKESGEILHDR